VAECRLWPEVQQPKEGGAHRKPRFPAPAPTPHPCTVFSPTEMTTLPRFRLKIAPRAPEMPEATAGPSTPPTVQRLDLRVEDPATSRRPGSFNYNQESSKYPHEWANMAEFDAWRRAEELAYSIELIAGHIAHRKTVWTQRRHYVCSHEPSGGSTENDRPERPTFRSKKSGCDCKIIIKSYPHMPTILGRYEEEHDHDVGLVNIAYTRLSIAARIQIRNMLERKVDSREIVRK
jgi:hypothetical protein